METLEIISKLKSGIEIIKKSDNFRKLQVQVGHLHSRN